MRWERVQRQVGLADSSSGPGKRWGHTCNAIKGGKFVYVFGGFGTDGCLTNQVHVFDAASHTWKRLEARGEVPDTREAHSATRIGKFIVIFGGRGKVSGLDDEVCYNDLYIVDTETIKWQRGATTGTRPFARECHTCSTWNKKFIVVGGQDFDGDYLSDVHILSIATQAWKQLKTSGQALTPRAGHVTVVSESNLFVFGGFADSKNLYNDLFVLNLETCVWSKIAIEEGPCVRFSAAAVCLGPYKPGSFFFVGGCNKNLEPLDDIYYLHTDIGLNEAWLARNAERKRRAISDVDADCDHREKTQRTLSKDSAGSSSQQAGPVDPSDDQVNAEPLRNEMSTDVGAAAEAGPGGDSSPQKQDEGRVAAEDANAEQ